MTAISIHELHEHTDLWVRKATEHEPIVLMDDGRAVAKFYLAEPDSANVIAAAPAFGLQAVTL